MIETVDPRSPYYQQVVDLGDANSGTLGFLPYEAIRQAASEDRVLVYVEGEDVKGYALFGKRVKTGDISLTHLCVDRGQRGQGVARELVEAIIHRHPHRAGIRLSCRKDYEADAMWPKLGFQRLGEKPGRSRAGHPLVTWWRPISALPLFGGPEPDDARLVVAIDTNVLLDILEERDFDASRGLTADWVSESVELTVTAQSLSELSNQDVGDEQSESAFGEFRALEPTQEAWHKRLRSLQGEPSVARLTEEDLRVVVQAASGGAAYLVSRDEDLLRQAEQVEQLAGLNLVRPDDFLLRLQALAGEHSHHTSAIAASGMSISTLPEMPSNAELSVYCHSHVGERSSELRQRLSNSIARGGRVEHLLTDLEEPLALAAMYREEGRVTVTALRSAAGQQSHAVVRQMVHHIRGIVAQEGSATVTVEDQTQPSVERALRDEGFKSEGSSWQAIVRVGTCGQGDALPQELRQFGWGGLNAHLVRGYERYAWPSKVFSGAVTSYMVPIKPEFARVLLGYEEPQARLFETHLLAAVARDNTYYMSPRPSLEAPARIVWWVSGGGAIGGVRAISWLDDVETGDPHRLYRKYRHRGVLDEEQVVGSAKPLGKTGRLSATALLFSQTEVFRVPVPIARARQLCLAMETGGYFQTTRPIDEVSVRAFYEEGVRGNG